MAACLLAPIAVLGQARIANSPPMGWNSYDCFSYAVTEQEVEENAQFMADHLKKLGWQYVVVDYVWSAPKLSPGGAPNQDKSFYPLLNMDEFGRLLPDPVRFPSSAAGKGFGPLADRIHKLGLKFGIHLMRGIPRQAVAADTPIWNSPYHASEAATQSAPCGWLNHMWGLKMDGPAGQAYLDSLFHLYAEWGVDFVKVDDLSNPYSASEVAGYRRAIDGCRRPIVLSLSPGPTPLEDGPDVTLLANMWRLLGDLWDTWDQVTAAFKPIADWTQYRGAGHWPDPDMLPLGRLRKFGPDTGPPNTDCRLTPDEQRTLMTLWCISRSPLMVGGNLPETLLATLNLLSNPEVINVDQHTTNNKPLAGGERPMWVADSLEHANLKYLAVFNRSDQPIVVNVRLSDLGVRECNVRDLWERKDLGHMQGVIRSPIPTHGAMLYQIFVIAEGPVTETILPTTNLTGDSYEAESPENTLSGTARVRLDDPAGKCSGGKFVCFIGSKPENTLQFNKVHAEKDGNYIVTIAYMSGSDRTMFVTVNGGEPINVSFPSTGGWDGRDLDTKEVHVRLKQGRNTILLGNPNDWGVNVDRIVVRHDKP